ncbi:MAG: hypothetical protein FJ109_15775 [Deltaproteobacteria bacterium]|nr:hypothetical protein [Deltaproteobacteria bacterium]
MRIVPPALFLAAALCPCPVHAAIWTASAAVVGSTVEVAVTVRLSGCAGIGRVERQVEGEDPFVVWQGDDTHAVDTAEPFDSCKCEPLGTAWGTGMKSCPEEQCGKDDQCVCTELCAPVVDSCPPPAHVIYAVFDRDGAPVAAADVSIPELLPGCEPPRDPKPIFVEEPDDGGGGGGCSTASAPSSPLALLLALVVLAGLRGRQRERHGVDGSRSPFRVRPFAILLTPLFCLCLAFGCARGKKEQKAAAAPQAPQPVESSVEGTPFEAVVSTQTALLDLFENGTTPESVLWRADRFRKKRVEQFRKECQQALDFYAEDAGNRMLILARAGRAWTVVEQRVKTLSAEWRPAQKRQADVLLDLFECR